MASQDTYWRRARFLSSMAILLNKQLLLTLMFEKGLIMYKGRHGRKNFILSLWKNKEKVQLEEM